MTSSQIVSKSPDKRSILFLVHVEEIFRRYMDEMFIDRLVDAMVICAYDEIVVLDSQKGDGGILKELRSGQCNYTVQHWEWGYAPANTPTLKTQWIIEARGHPYTYIPPFMRERQIELQSMSVFVGGGADGECLTDWEDVLLFLDIPYTREVHLIY